MDLELVLKKRLQNWAYWEISFIRGDRGYPGKSTIADFGRGSMEVRYGKPPFTLDNLEAQEMRTWINIMGKENAENKEALKAFYLTRYNIDQLAKELNIPKRTFCQRLHDARTWLKGRLSVMYEKDLAR